MRKLLGKKLFAVVGRYYRAIFVNLNTVAKFMAAEIPKDAHVLDIGGGDGEPLNHLLAKRRDIKVTMIDLTETIGNSLSSEFKDRVVRLPGMSIAKFMATQPLLPDCIVVSDVIHHVDPEIRGRFFAELHELVRKSSALLLIKDIEPGSFVSLLSYLSDYYISGDKRVKLISMAELCRTIKQVFGDAAIKDSGLLAADSPNYMVSITLS